MSNTDLDSPDKLPHGLSHPSLTNQRWQARLIVSLIMLALAFVSLIIIGLPRTYWIFTCVMAGCDALLCIGLVWYIKRRDPKASPGCFWQIILHWIGLFVVIYLLILSVNRGMIAHTEAGLFSLLVLALTLYLAGIYADATFILIGLVLALMAAGMILIKSYLWIVMIPVLIIVGLIIFLMVTRESNPKERQDSE